MLASGRPLRIFTVAFAILIAVILGSFLLAADGSIPSHRGGDTVRYTAAARGFFVDEMRSGNFPLWNPHTFSGTPFVGVFQSAVFYPSGLLYFVLPLSIALTLDFALHLLLLGVSTFAWLTRRGHGPLGAGFAAIVTAFGATAFLRVTAGQFTVLGTIAWVPLLLICVEHLIERPSLGWVLAGTGLTTIMVFAGHPPTLFMAGMATAAYCAVFAFSTPVRGRASRVVASLACIPVAAILLSAIQLFTGLEIAREGVRQAGASIEFATTYSMPPEGLLSLFVPELYADIGESRLAYWGRWFYWDTSAYMGVIGLLFAIHGAIVARGWRRNGALALGAIFCVLALGRYTPVYEVLFDVVPGFNLFRAPSKFMFFATLFAAPLVALGVDHARESATGARTTAWLAGGLALVLAVCAIWAHQSSVHPTASHSIMHGLAALAQEPVPNRPQLERWRAALVPRIATAFGFAAAGACLFFLRREHRTWTVLALVVVGTADLTLFAHRNRMGSTVPPANRLLPVLTGVFDRIGDDRVLVLERGHNMALYLRGYSVWGYDPIKLDRYAQFIARSQGLDSFDLDQPLSEILSRFDPRLRMVRTRVEVSKHLFVREIAGALPRFLLVDGYRIAQGIDAARDEVFAPDFDPWRTVILEQPPHPEPMPGLPVGEVRLIDESTDHFDIEVEVDRAAILLVTDAYARGWRARALPGSVQSEYDLLPADSTLRAVPLAAGRHVLRVEYVPAGFVMGRRVSSAALLVYVSTIASWAGSSRRRRLARASTGPVDAA